MGSHFYFDITKILRCCHYCTFEFILNNTFVKHYKNKLKIYQLVHFSFYFLVLNAAAVAVFYTQKDVL